MNGHSRWNASIMARQFHSSSAPTDRKFHPVHSDRQIAASAAAPAVESRAVRHQPEVAEAGVRAMQRFRRDLNEVEQVVVYSASGNVNRSRTNASLPGHRRSRLRVTVTRAIIVRSVNTGGLTRSRRFSPYPDRIAGELEREEGQACHIRGNRPCPSMLATSHSHVHAFDGGD